MNPTPVMFCPNCLGPKNRLIRMTQHRKFNYLRRRRKCLECDHTWNTLEIVESEITVRAIE